MKAKVRQMTGAVNPWLRYQVGFETTKKVVGFEKPAEVFNLLGWGEEYERAEAMAKFECRRRFGVELQV